MFNVFFLFVLSSFASLQMAQADPKAMEVKGVKGTSLSAQSFDKKYGGWRDIEYRSAAVSFKIYAVPIGVEPSEDGVVANPDADSISPDNRYLIIQRTNAGEVVDDEGTTIISSQAYCDVISMETGCIKNIGSAQQCEGTWQDDKWKTSRGEFFDFSKGSKSPRLLISDASRDTESQSRASSLRDHIFMGVPSYMACYPPENNISEYNDMGFYFAQGGEHLLAMQIYKRLLLVAPDRVPLKLNVADSLWALGKGGEAKKYYAEYLGAMKKKSMESKIPSRVKERLN
jgi:hypothetical protein